MSKRSVSEVVQDQYEQYPYPPRNPEDERSRLIATASETLASINQYCYRGEQTFENFRCLIAGGGTGDATIFLAEQLRHRKGQVVYIDMSVASRAIAEERARIRGLTNIEWITGTLDQLPDLGLEPFDYINCSGVLHHLPDPDAGLGWLNSVLKSDGSIYLMLYGKYGRTAIYQMQDLLRRITSKDDDLSTQIKIARAVLEKLPVRNWFQRERDGWRGDLENYGDAGLVDLLLHQQDRAYDVRELYQMAEKAGLEITSFSAMFSHLYQMPSQIDNKLLNDRYKKMGKIEQQAYAELLIGDISKHQLFLSRQPDRKTDLSDLSNAMVLDLDLAGRHMEIHQTMKPGETLTIQREGGNSVVLNGNPILKSLFMYFDGKTPLERAIKKTLLKNSKTTRAAVIEEIQTVYDLLHPMEWIFLTKT